MTFSLALRCPRTGMFGVAATTSSLCVGSRCTFVRAGVGAVLTQHRTDSRLGPRGLGFLQAGLDAQATIDALVASTPHASWRQLAVVDRKGQVAFFQGGEQQPIFAAATGAGVVAVGNILRNGSICAAQIRAVEESVDQHIGDRLLLALEAGLAAGGEVFALQSAAMLIADVDEFPLVDLRIDCHDEPLAALRQLWTAYRPSLSAFVERANDPMLAGPATNSLAVLNRADSTETEQR